MKEKILDAMQRSIESGSCSGANVLVIKDGEEQVYCDYGYRDMVNININLTISSRKH